MVTILQSHKRLDGACRVTSLPPRNKHTHTHRRERFKKTLLKRFWLQFKAFQRENIQRNLQRIYLRGIEASNLMDIYKA